MSHKNEQGSNIFEVKVPIDDANKVAFNNWLITQEITKTKLNAYKELFCKDGELFDSFRSIVLEIHMWLESIFNSYICGIYLKESLSNENIADFEDRFLDRITFSDKICFIKKTTKMTGSMKEKIMKIAALRNQLAHYSSKPILYKDIDVKKNKDSAMEEMFKDFMAIIDFIIVDLKA